MGDRGNIRVKDWKSGAVYLYSHWGGSGLPHLVRDVLKREQRWDDPLYLARMLFSTMVGDDTEGETGFGISVTIGDNTHPVVCVDCKKQLVGWNSKLNHKSKKVDESKFTHTWPFKDYLDLTDEQLAKSFEGNFYPEEE